MEIQIHLNLISYIEKLFSDKFFHYKKYTYCEIFNIDVLFVEIDNFNIYFNYLDFLSENKKKYFNYYNI
jgi:hypothetical protein